MNIPESLIVGLDAQSAFNLLACRYLTKVKELVERPGKENVEFFFDLFALLGFKKAISDWAIRSNLSFETQFGLCQRWVSFFEKQYFKLNSEQKISLLSKIEHSLNEISHRKDQKEELKINSNCVQLFLENT
jgi:hypothetical protein